MLFTAEWETVSAPRPGSAGGSIGRELCRQVARCDPAAMILLGRGESSIFEIGLDLQISFCSLVTHLIIADIRDRGRIDQVVEKYRPDVILRTMLSGEMPDGCYNLPRLSLVLDRSAHRSLFTLPNARQ